MLSILPACFQIIVREHFSSFEQKGKPYPGFPILVPAFWIYSTNRTISVTGLLSVRKLFAGASMSG
jgi:hypothetical protein